MVRNSNQGTNQCIQLFWKSLNVLVCLSILCCFKPLLRVLLRNLTCISPTTYLLTIASYLSWLRRITETNTTRLRWCPCLPSLSTLPALLLERRHAASTDKSWQLSRQMTSKRHSSCSTRTWTTTSRCRTWGSHCALSVLNQPSRRSRDSSQNWQITLRAEIRTKTRRAW